MKVTDIQSARAKRDKFYDDVCRVPAIDVVTRLEIMGALVALLPPEGTEQSFDYLQTVREAAEEIRNLRRAIGV